jgi:hypothetical protein
MDLKNSDIGACQSTGTIGADSEDSKIASAAFWCDGVKSKSPEDEKKEDDKPKGKSGSVSESACMAGKAPFFNHPKTDTCVNLKTEKMKVYSAGICANGTQSILAMYKDKGCSGAPARWKRIEEDDTKSCMDMAGLLSFAFYCSGVKDSKPNPGGDQRQGGSIMQFLLVLTLICLMFFLMLVLSIFAWVRKYGGSVRNLITLITVSIHLRLISVFLEANIF